MKLLLVREPSTDSGTFSKFYVNGMYQCESLEDVDRRLEDGGKKIPDETAIPRGVYKVIIDWSNRFKKEMLHVLDVPGFEGIRIHAGNTNADTEGCLLLGTGRANGWLLNSRAAVDRVFATVETALDKGEEVTLEVR